MLLAHFKNVNRTFDNLFCFRKNIYLLVYELRETTPAVELEHVFYERLRKARPPTPPPRRTYTRPGFFVHDL